MHMESLLDMSPALPSLPRAVALLMTELAHDEPNLRRINQLFGTDPALAARLLEQANRADFGLSGQLAGIPEALALLDVPHLRALVQTAPLGTTSRSVPGMNLQHFWRYSRNTAKLARSLAGTVRQNPVAAYTAGLLHGLGELLIHWGHPDKMPSINALLPPLDIRRSKLELRMLGYCYGEVSAALARRWQLPQEVIDALNYQDAPFINQVYEPLAGVIHLAAWRARAREADMNDKELAVTFPAEVGLALGLDIDMVLQQDPIDWHARPYDD
ncbi:MAG: HDOD domain-containing protein [Burkholderiaceae bacterium]|nr:HDOD domain-containing protein [Burkholderiaceae bacterium]